MHLGVKKRMAFLAKVLQAQKNFVLEHLIEILMHTMILAYL